ncbi:MAG: hypothetical protein IJE10_11205 [Clostridia bacterium]|nr:hypothetical protein [Clostridia bacterium]
MQNDKSEKLMDWLLTCPYIKDLFFIFGDPKNGDTVLYPETGYNDEWDEGMPYIDGSGDKIYTFTIIQFVPYTENPNSKENVEHYQGVQRVASWIDEQGEKGNYPEFPGGSVINKMEVLPFENGGLAGMDENGAKFMFSIRINYFYEGE